MPTWPSTLPQQVLQRGYSQGFGDNVIRSPADSGAEKRRRRFTSVVDPLNCYVRITIDQIEILKTFYRDDIKSGALAFDFPDPLSATDPPATLRVAFRSPPRWRNIGGIHFDVQLRLGIQP